MRKSIVLLTTMLLAVAAGQANAKTLSWHGTLDLDFGVLRSLRIEGSGVATVNDSSGGNHLDTLRLAGGLSGSGIIPVTDPEGSGTIQSIRPSVTLGTGTISGISGAPPLNPPATIPIKGFTRVCLFTAGCGSFLPLNNTTNNGATGLGVGGLLTLGNVGPVRISLENAPWTISGAAGILQTHEGAFITREQHGFVHNASSTPSSSEVGNSKVVQLIASQQVTTSGIAGNSTKMTLFAVMTLHFIPEPGLFLLIGSGVVGLGLLGRSRMKK